MAYCTRANIEAIFGTHDVAEWADLNNDDDAADITARITWAITVAQAECNDFFRIAGYSLNSSGEIVTEAAATPTSVTYHCAMLAGVLLYEWQGVQNFDPRTGQPGHKLAWHRLQVYQYLDQVATGKRRLDAV